MRNRSRDWENRSEDWENRSVAETPATRPRTDIEGIEEKKNITKGVPDFWLFFFGFFAPFKT